MEAIESENIVQENLRLVMEHRRLGDGDVATIAQVAQRTIFDVRMGNSTPQRNTLRKLEKALGVRLTDKVLEHSELGARLGYAHSKYGGYRFEDVAGLKGDYLLYRRSYDYDDGVVVSHLRIDGADTDDCFRFLEKQSNLSREGEKHEYSFKGIVAIVPQASVLQLRSRTREDENVIRKTMNFRLSDEDKMLGVVSGLKKDTYMGYFPVSSPVIAHRSSDRMSSASVQRSVGSKSLEEIDPGVLSKLKEVSRLSFASL